MEYKSRGQSIADRAEEVKIKTERLVDKLRGGARGVDNKLSNRN
ncbi:hypothetical protein ACM26V_00480 [Salipaludibacillus sp. HK11]